MEQEQQITQELISKSCFQEIDDMIGKMARLNELLTEVNSNLSITLALSKEIDKSTGLK